MKRIFTLVSVCMALTASALDPNHFTITRITAPYFVVDGNSPTTITSAYVGFEVKNNSNSATTYSGIKFTITSIGTTVVGQNYSLLSPVSGITNVGTLAPGQSKVCYYYVSYPANVTPQATFNIQLTDNTAGIKTQSFVISNRSSISANAGGTATQTFSNQDIIGGLITDDVVYVVGNVQNGDESDFQVAVSSQFDPTKVTLLGTQVIASSVPGIPNGTTDSLYFVTGNGTNGATITVRWTFRITGFNFTTYLLPCAGATSGSTNYKYALNTSLGSGTPVTVSSTANPLTISKTSDHTIYGVTTIALFTITIQNPGVYGVTIDKITDEIPAGFSFQSIDGTSAVTSANSTSVPANGATGTITFEGGVLSGGNTSYYVPAGGSIVLKYTATTASSSTSSLLTTARSYIATTLVGSAQNTVRVSSTLPVTILSFKAAKNNGFVKLDWTTANEINSDLFEIEKGNSFAGFSKIAVVRSIGSSSSVTSYSFIDSFPLAGVNYYRLKAVDKDQQYKYSAVIAINNKQQGISVQRIYPNPFSDNISIRLIADKKQPVRMELTDLTGRLVLNKTITCLEGTNDILVPQLEKLNRGTYFLQFISNDATQRVKLVKAN
jgi:hypothetical protein